MILKNYVDLNFFLYFDERELFYTAKNFVGSSYYILFLIFVQKSNCGIILWIMIVVP